jgi:iron-sulfur cluster repair protein YtfE (RIC family)
MITKPLRDEHGELLTRIERLKELADSVGTEGIEALRRGIQEVEEFLHVHLIPHALTEDRVLYPAVNRLMGAEQATATMSRDHHEVGKLTEELSGLAARLDGQSLSKAQQQQLRRLLYGLYALVKLHFAKEEEIYLPLLDARLNREEGQALFDTMKKTAAQLSRNARSADW